MMSEFGLLMPFKGENKDPIFVKGFECGMIWEGLERKIHYEKKAVHKDNEEQIRMMLDRAMYEYEFEEYDDEWTFLTARPKGTMN